MAANVWDEAARRAAIVEARLEHVAHDDDGEREREREREEGAGYEREDFYERRRELN